MRNLFISFIITFSFISNIFGQTHNGQLDNTNAFQIAKQYTSVMVSSLELNKIQEDSVFAINSYYYQSIASLADMKLPHEERINNIHVIENNWKNRLYQNLDHQQFKKFFDQLSENMKIWQKKNDSLSAAKHH